MQRTATGLSAADPSTDAALAQIDLGAFVVVKITRPRSLAQHRLFFAVLTHVAEATDFDTPEQLLVALKIALGRYDLMKLPNGKVVPVPQSISFASMPHDAFCRFFDDAVRLICRDVLPGVLPDDLLNDAGLSSAVAEMRKSPFSAKSGQKPAKREADHIPGDDPIEEE